MTNSAPVNAIIEEIPVQVETPAEKKTSGKILLKVFSKSERTKRSVLTLAGFWLLAIFSVLIPVAHFVLVPAFLLLAPFLAYLKWQQDAGIIGGECFCPECKEKLALGSMKLKWPLTTSCLSCKATIYIQKK